MRVLFHLDSINRGGAETQALDVCRNAARFGIEITVVAGGGHLEQEFRTSGVEFLKFNRKFPVDPSLIRFLRNTISNRNIEIVHGYQAVEGLHLHLACLGLPRIRKVLSFQGFVPDAKNRRVLRLLIPRMDANVYVSNGLKNWLSATDGLSVETKSLVIYNGADPNRVRRSGSLFREVIGVTSGTLMIGMVANFYRDPRKDQLTLVRSLPAVFSRIPSAICIFAGGVENGAEAKLSQCRDFCESAGIADRVHFLGRREDVPDILAELDAFVFSSLQEGLPVALTEAMLAGVPTVVSDIEPHLEATGNGGFAHVFKTGDANDLAAKLIDLLTDEGARTALGERAKKFADENFSIDAHLRSLSSLYRDLIDNGSV